MGERVSFERPSYELRERGSFTARGARVYAGTPTALHPMRDDLPVNRLGLARWLVDANNPLVARVAVNRLWEQLFGRGIVETSEDFGTQGAAPSHPALLDWLATELVGEGLEPEGDHPLRSSSLPTYRQSSAAARRCSSAIPPTGCWRAARGSASRPRQSATCTLAISGLLSPKMHGPSVFPPSRRASGTCLTTPTTGRRARARIAIAAASTRSCAGRLPIRAS